MLYDINDTIVAVSSPAKGPAILIRITGPKTFNILKSFFDDFPEKPTRRIFTSQLKIDDQLQIDAKIYLYPAPNSYTSDDLAEIHFLGSESLAEIILNLFLSSGPRLAQPGEFTARAYLNNRIDLTQAEAVSAIVAGSNRFQVAAAEKLLTGSLAQNIGKIRRNILDVITLIEASLDFSEEDITFLEPTEAFERIQKASKKLKQILDSSIAYEAMLDLPAVAIAGPPNAGKSSLINVIIGKKRSIVSPQKATTRDVLTSILSLDNSRCIIFDCAGLQTQQKLSLIDDLACQAATQAIHNASLTLFCIDLSKSDYTDDLSVLKLIDPQNVIFVATKSDLLNETQLTRKLKNLKSTINHDFIITSSKTKTGLTELKKEIDNNLTAFSSDSVEADKSIATTARHRQSIEESIELLTRATDRPAPECDELTADLLRNVYKLLETVQTTPIDDEILNQIFSTFCIGK